MHYDIVQKPSFYNDLWPLPQNVQRRVSQACRRIQNDPFRADGNSKRVLKHQYRNLYRYRIGDYRLVYGVGDQCVAFLAIGHRSDIYDRFRAAPDDLAPDPVNAASAEPKVIPTTSYDTAHFVHTMNDDIDGASEATSTPSPQAPPAKSPDLLAGLLHVWEVDAEHHQSILNCRTVDDLLNIDAPDEVKERLLHWHEPPTIDRILEQPTMALDDTADLDRYMEGNLKHFLLKLDPEQKRVANRSLQGPTLVKGGPGTGKSLVALYRLKNLMSTPGQSRLFAEEHPRILFVTYTRALTNVSDELLHELLDEKAANVDVLTLDSKVREIIQQSGQHFRPANASDEKKALDEALAEMAGSGDPGPLANIRPDYLLDEFQWVIEGRGIDTLAAYLTEDRTGRGIRFDRATRTTVWDLYETFLCKLGDQGPKTWNAYRRQAADIVREMDDNALYDIVIIDEAQDLTPVALRLCIELCKHPTGLYLTADASQSIYSRGFSWQRVHEDLQVRGRTTILKRNYRMTRQISAAAAQLLLDAGDGDDEALETEAVHWGPSPVLATCRDMSDEMAAVAEFLRLSARQLHMPVSNGAVLVRNNRLAGSTATALTKLGIPAQHMKSSEVTLDTDKVRVMTIHAAKGLEFPFVAVPHVNNGSFPYLPRGMQHDEREEQISNERRLFFVAMSRAMRRLLVTYQQAKPSPFVEELDKQLWDTGKQFSMARSG